MTDSTAFLTVLAMVPSIDVRKNLTARYRLTSSLSTLLLLLGTSAAAQDGKPSWGDAPPPLDTRSPAAAYLKRCRTMAAGNPKALACEAIRGAGRPSDVVRTEIDRGPRDVQITALAKDDATLLLTSRGLFRIPTAPGEGPLGDGGFGPREFPLGVECGGYADVLNWCVVPSGRRCYWWGNTPVGAC